MKVIGLDIQREEIGQQCVQRAGKVVAGVGTEIARRIKARGTSRMCVRVMHDRFLQCGSGVGSLAFAPLTTRRCGSVNPWRVQRN